MASKNSKKQLETVSVITTFYNADKFVINCINSVFQQKCDDVKIEYVIVDDKSPDKSREIIEKFFDENKKNNFTVNIFTPEENLGCGGARKYGIDHATGDYFMFLDADDYYMNIDFITRAYNDLKINNADIVEYGVLFNTPDGGKTNNVAPRQFIIENNPSVAKIALFKDNLIKFNVWSKIYKRWVVESYPYNTSRTYEDVRTIPIWVHNAKKIVIQPSIEINYRAAEGSIIRTDMVNTRVGTITAIAELFPMFKDDYQVLKAMYSRSMVDLEALLHNHSSNDPGFNEMSKLNTFMLSFIYPNQYKDITYHLEFDPELQEQKNQQTPQYEEIPEELLKDDDIKEEVKEGYYGEDDLNKINIE